MTLEQIRGCLLGLAVGDALGAPVEFMSLAAIKQRYGPQGITDLDDWSGFPAGSYTDDTQMTLSTIEGMLAAQARGRERGIVNWQEQVYHAYLRWLETQNEAYQRRAPGNTCLSALRSGTMGVVATPINNSKGCGGVMRTAPVGLILGAEDAFIHGMDYAAITHGHPSGYLSAGYMAALIACIVEGDSLQNAIQRCNKLLVAYPGHEETLDLVQRAVTVHRSGVDVENGIRQLGEGWIGEEALGIALFCALRFPNDYVAAVIAGANHDGDTDSTASMVGAILGAQLGASAIPSAWIEQIENRDLLEKLAAELQASFS
ncbi:MAG: ADP-ribosylglycohydrolase family protein [Caldilineaceae bacterium]|nr:ADP-ribosylglycohydrolase family protein [Caldilineaceae bacterium]